MARVLVVGRGNMNLTVLVLMHSMMHDVGCLDVNLYKLNPFSDLETIKKEKIKFDRAQNFSRRDNFIPQQPRYNRQFGNGGNSGRVPYKFKREKHLYRSENR